MTETEKRGIVRQLDCDAARLEMIAVFARDEMNMNTAEFIDEIVYRMHDAASIIEANVEVTE